MKKFSLATIKRWLRQHTVVKAMMAWTKGHSLPGFQEQSIFNVVRFIIRELKKDRLITRANSISFSFFLSLFPTVIAFFTLIPLLLPFIFNQYIIELLPSDADFVYDIEGNINFVETLILQINTLLPNVIGRAEVIELVRDIVSQPKPGLLSFGFFLAIFFASNGMMSMMSGFAKSYPSTFIKRKPIRKRLVAIGLLFLLSGFVFLAILLLILNNQLIAFAPDPNLAPASILLIIKILRYVIILGLVYFSISMIYRYGAPTITRTKVFTVGTTLATTGAFLSTILFGFYVDNFVSFNKIYGSIGTIIIVMLWIQLNALSVLIGYELNASIAVNKDLNENPESYRKSP